MHRRLLAALLTAAAVAATVEALAPPEPRTVAVTVAARDLPAGRALASGDLTTARLASAAVPDGAVRPSAGAILAAPMRRGEPLTDARLVGPSLAAAHPGLVAVPIRLPDAAMAALLDPGDRIDLYAVAAGGDPSAPAGAGAAAADGAAGGAGAGAGGAILLATDVLVLAVPAADAAGTANGADGLSGRLVVVGLGPGDVPAVTASSVRAFLTYAYGD